MKEKKEKKQSLTLPLNLPIAPPLILNFNFISFHTMSELLRVKPHWTPQVEISTHFSKQEVLAACCLPRHLPLDLCYNWVWSKSVSDHVMSDFKKIIVLTVTTGTLVCLRCNFRKYSVKIRMQHFDIFLLCNWGLWHVERLQAWWWIQTERYRKQQWQCTALWARVSLWKKHDM